MNARSPPVESAAEVSDARCSWAHTSRIVRTSNAANLPILPSVPGISKKRRSACVPPEPSLNSTWRPEISRQVWLSGMMIRLLPG